MLRTSSNCGRGRRVPRRAEAATGMSALRRTPAVPEQTLLARRTAATRAAGSPGGRSPRAGFPWGVPAQRVIAGCASLWRTLSETTGPSELGGPRAGGLTDQVVALGDVRSPTGGIRVRRGGGSEIAAELVQVTA